MQDIYIHQHQNTELKIETTVKPDWTYLQHKVIAPNLRLSAAYSDVTNRTEWNSVFIEISELDVS